MINSIKMQMIAMFRKKTVAVTYFILFGFVLVNLFTNMKNYMDIQYVTEMYSPFKMLTLSTWSESGYFFMNYFPLLVVVPTACAYLTDKDTRMKIYIQTKTGSEKYWYGKLITVFATTFFVFTIPFLFEILCSCICFSLKSMGDPSNVNYVQFVENEGKYFMGQIWMDNQILYVVLLTLMFGVAAGVLAMFNFAVTTLPFFKYKIMTFFPIYLLFYLISSIELFRKPGYTLNYFLILRMFDTSKKNWLVYFVFLIFLILISVGIIKLKSRKDDFV